jgi:O-antigen ligase
MDLSKTKQRMDTFFLVLIMIVLPVVAHAGGLGVAPAAAIGGGAAILGRHPKTIWTGLKNAPPSIFLVFLLLLWGLLSTMWSPYPVRDFLSNPVKLLIGLGLFLSCAGLIVRRSYTENTWPRRLFIGSMWVSGVALFGDIISGYALTLALDPPAPGTDITLKYGDIVQNLGHGVTVLTLFMPVVVVLLWNVSRLGKIYAGLFAALVLACGVVSGVSSALVAAMLALLVMGLASYRPYLAVWMSFLLAQFVILAAPFLAFMAVHMPDEMKHKLAFSWHERVDNWGYLYGRIFEHPLVGHGFDAVRTFNETHTIRGFEGRAIVSLHPHNAGLHIWVELGLVGALIAAAALFIGSYDIRKKASFSHAQLIAISGVCIAATIISGLSYGVWQDWWWASIILSAGVISMIKHTATKFDN